jgi:hypothetical protein
MQAKGSPTDLLRILALCTSRILGRLTADPLLCITDRSFVSRLFRLSKERGCSRVPSFFFGSDCGLAPTQEEPNHERCASLQNHSFRADNTAASRGGQTMFRLCTLRPPMRINQSQGNHLGFAPSRPQFANQILHFLGTRRVVGVHGAGRSPRRSYCHGYFPSSKPGWPSPHMSGNRSRRRRELADALGAAQGAA